MSEQVTDPVSKDAAPEVLEAPAAASTSSAVTPDAPTGKKAKEAKPKKEAKADAKEAKDGDAKPAKESKAKKVTIDSAAKDQAFKEDVVGSKFTGGEERFSFPNAEVEVLDYWTKIDAFQTSVKLSQGRPEFTFYDGPPFATGKPHHGHILAGTIKDIVTRYAHQTGHHVDRRFGWDCHGVPIEYEIDKAFKITGPEDVKKMGLDNYNAECRAIVMRYSSEWKTIMTRLGRWIDFDNDYKTMYPWFMESVWWVFGQLFTKGLVYRGFKVMPFSTALSTPLSNFEANQEMKEVVDPAVTVAFPVIGEDYSLLAWTTTPWTLPSNLALCVNPEFEYALFEGEVPANPKVKGRYVALVSRLAGVKGALYKEINKGYTVIRTFKGSELLGKQYEPLFPYFVGRPKAFTVLGDSYVTDDSGTGIVHQAPGHGEDDFRVCHANGLISNEDIPCPLDATGRYVDPVTDFKGMYVKDADKPITHNIKEKGRLFHVGTITHAYGYCWRSDTPLIRKTVSSWFVRVESFKDRLIKNNQQTHWVPSNIRDGRFHNWLADARDWAISRNRYWGTPIPLWVNDDLSEVVCITSIAELEQRSGVKNITDLHRETIDKITIPSKDGKGVLHRIDEVFDCWFESGSMPYAQKHYPFEHKERFEASFPADFIAEGVDQTRGWFYTLMVLSTALFDQPPFKNLIVNGLVLAADGQKMSKRKQNYPDPVEVITQDSADALRLYLIDSPVVRAEVLCFKRAGVQSVIKDVFLPWLNAFRFFEQNTAIYNQALQTPFVFDEFELCSTENVMDKWILAYTQSLVKFVHAEMREYRLYTVVPRLLKFIESLTNWYVRFNRKRFKATEGSKDDAHNALWTLGEVLLTLTKLMAPFTPFFAEWVYLRLRKFVVGSDPAFANNWSSDRVASWLNKNNLAQYTDLFNKHGIRGSDLLDLSHQDLQSMGIDRCTDRKAILRQAKELAQAQPAAPLTVVVNGVTVTETDSVHFQMLPAPKDAYNNDNIERAFATLRRVVDAGRLLRDQKTLPVKLPLREFVVISKDAVLLEDMRFLQEYITSELNVINLTVSSDRSKFNVKLRAHFDQKAAGALLKDDFKTVAKLASELSQESLLEFEASGSIVFTVGEGRTAKLTTVEMKLAFECDTTANSTYAALADEDILVLLDVSPSQDMIDQGIAREVVNRIQKLRKKANLQPIDPITVYAVVSKDTDLNLANVLTTHAKFISESLSKPFVHGPPPPNATAVADEAAEVKDAHFQITIVRS